MVVHTFTVHFIATEQIIKIAENSNVYRSELDILKLISKEIKNRPIKPKLLKNWGLALVKSCLISKRPNDAKAIASRLSIEIPFNSDPEGAAFNGPVCIGCIEIL